ncbi:MAG: hypothetical protein AAFX09_05970 [Pseudomonadota bacterium]
MRTMIIAFSTALLALAACAEPTPYQPIGDGGRYGFDQIRIEDDRYRVSFSGNSLTDRETVELFLLYRAAELTLERGYDHFRVVTRDTDEETRRFSQPRYSAFDVHYRYYHPRYGWYGWRDPFWDDVSMREITRYHASAEIRFGRGAAPDSADAFEAREVTANLRDRIVAPDAGAL